MQTYAWRPAVTVAAAIALGGAATAGAAPISSAGSGDWTNTTTWSTATVPTIGDDVTIQAGDTVTINDTNAHDAASLTIQTGGVLTHGDNGSTAAFKVVLTIAGGLTIDAGGQINVDRLGYDFGMGPAPGGSNFGASHGGRGGHYNGPMPAATYGSVVAPTTLGSGGPQAGAEGGGAVILNVAGAVVHNGLVCARGGPDVSGTGGGGAGGSIFITAGSISGSGTNDVSVPDNGGTYTAGGGGGRIAIVVTNAIGFGSVVNRASGGLGRYNSNPDGIRGGAAGTIYLKDTDDTYGSLVVDNADAEDRDWWGIYTDLPPGTHQFDTIVATNAGLPNVATNAALDLSGGPSLMIDTNSRLIVGGGTLGLPADFTIGSGNTISFFGTNMNVWTANVTVANGGVLTHERNTWTIHGAHTRLVLAIDGRLTVDAGGEITALAKGYEAPHGPLGGGGHWGGGNGGRGGVYSGPSGDALFGSIVAPVDIGSGGSSNGDDAEGGGAIRLTVSGATTNNGVIAANGESNALGSGGGGGGAGGSVFLTTATLAGNGSITADGGDGEGQYNGGGGGGRVAVVVTGGATLGNQDIHAYGGMGRFNSGDDARYVGGAGTVYTKTAVQSYGHLIIDNDGRVGNEFSETPITTNVVGRTFDDIVIRNDGRLTIEDEITLSCRGSWSNGATLLAETGSAVRLDGVATATVSGTNAFYDLYCTNALKTIRFAAGSLTTIQPFGTLTLQGDSGGVLTLDSTAASAWNLVIQSNALQAVRSVDVAYSDASGGRAVLAPGSTNSGNNLNWRFDTGLTLTWTGDTHTDWETASNWDGGWVADYLDTAIIPDVGGASGNFPVLGIHTLLAHLTNEANASIALDGNNLTVTGNTVSAGAIIAAGTETVTLGGDVDFSGGSYTRARSRIVLDGMSLQSFDADGNIFHGLDVDNAAGVDFTAAFTAKDLFATGAGATLTFLDGATYGLTNLILRGVSGTPIALRSATGGAWSLNVSGWHAVRHVDVEDSDASGGKTIYAPDSVHDGSTVNWDFGDWSVWDGSDSTDWATAANWEGDALPGAASNVWIDGNGSNAPAIAATATVNRLVVGPVATTKLTVDTNLATTVDALIGPAGTVTHTGPADIEGGRVNLSVGGDFFVAENGAIGLTSKGYNARKGPGTTGGNNSGSHGGHGWPLGGVCYGSMTAPVRWGSGGHSSAGGGAVQLTVAGITTLDGEIQADSDPGVHYPGAGGSVYIRTGHLQGDGTISANGNTGTKTSGSGGGGRVAAYLTAGTSFGNVSITAHDGPLAGNAAAGTIYLETATDGSGRGRLLIENSNPTPTTATTEIPPAADAVPGELVRATMILSNTVDVLLTTNAWVGDILVYTNAFMTLGAYELHVDSLEHSLENADSRGPGATNRVDFYEQVLWEGAPFGTIVIVR